MSDQEKAIVGPEEDTGTTQRSGVCRLCRDKDVEVIDKPRFEKLASKIMYFLQIDVSVGQQWSLVICPTCESQINAWEVYYDRVQRNEALATATVVEEDEDVVASVLYEMGTIKGEEEQSREGNMKYTVVCIPKEEGQSQTMILMDETDNEAEEDVLVGEGEEDADVEQDSNRTFGYALMDDEVGAMDSVVADDEEDVDNDDVDQNPEGEEDETSDDDDIIEQKSEQLKNKQGRPRKKKPPTTLAYLTQRDEQDELIRQTVSLDCDVCFESYATFEELLVHYKDVHDNANGYVKCCEKTFKRRYVLLEHVKLHINPDQYACPNCQKRFSTKRHLSDHIVLHIPEEDREFQCQQCLKRYATRARLIVHQKSHNEEFSYPCPYCEKSFRQEVIMKSHIKSVHEGSNQHICEICAKVFKTKEGFVVHQVEHLETPPERLKCEICGGKYKNKESLKYHLLRHKRADERYYCDVCSREFTSKKRMSAHRKYVHATESQMFQCNLCDKTFKRPISLKEHLAAHTGQLLYTCSYCPKQFNSNANKYSHQKAQHPQEWESARQERLAA